MYSFIENSHKYMGGLDIGLLDEIHNMLYECALYDSCLVIYIDYTTYIRNLSFSDCNIIMSGKSISMLKRTIKKTK